MDESVAVLRAAGATRSLSMALESLAAQLLLRSGRYREAAAAIRESVTLVQRSGDRSLDESATAAALHLATGDLADAEAVCRQMLTASERLDAREAANARAEATDLLARVAHSRGDMGAAAAFAADSRATAEAFGLDALRVRALELEARLALIAGEHDQAERLCRLGLEVLEPIEARSDPWDIHTAVSLLRCHADVALARERLDDAAARFGRTLEAALRLDCRRGALDAIGGAAILLLKRGERERGAALLDFVARHPASAAATRRDAHRAAQRFGLAVSTKHDREATMPSVRAVAEEVLAAIATRS